MINKKVLIGFFSILVVCVSSAQTVIQMTRSNGVSVIPCNVNGLNLNFIYDTGASDVSLSLVEAGFMLKNGYLAESDFIGSQKYSDANGNIEEGVTINLRSIIIGGLLIKDIQATIVKNTKAPLLLGQTALSKLGIVQQDFVKNTLTIYTNGTIPKVPISNTSQSNTPNKLEIVINGEDGSLTKFRVVPLNQIVTKPKPNIEYFWYNQDNNSLESNVGEWGGPLLNGKYQVYYPNGKLAESGFFLNGVRNGEFKTFSNEALLIEINNFKSGKLAFKKNHYNRFVFDFDSSLHKDGYAWWKEDFVKNTDTIFYYNYRDQMYRLRVDLFGQVSIVEFWPNGKLKRRFQHWDNEETRQRFGEYIEYYENGKIKVKGKYLDQIKYGHHFNGLPTGKWNVYNQDGKIRNIITFRRDTVFSPLMDTIWIGLSMHDRFSTDSLARIGWKRIDEWHVVQVLNPENYGFIDYPKWRPESIGNFFYPEFIEKVYSDIGIEEYKKLLKWYDDYSILFAQFPHVFE